MTEDTRTAQARKIAELRYGFLWHLPIYVIVNLGLIGVWLFTGQGFFWPIFSIFFWGICLWGHYLSAYRTSGPGWIDRETERILVGAPQARGLTV
jgi:hypothetical protein